MRKCHSSSIKYLIQHSHAARLRPSLKSKLVDDIYSRYKSKARPSYVYRTDATSCKIGKL